MSFYVIQFLNGLVAASSLFLVAAGLFIRTFQQVAAVPLGFSSEQVLVADVNATRATVDPAARPDFYARLTKAVAAVPGVTTAASSLNTPVNHGVTLVGDFNFVLAGRSVVRQARTLLDAPNK